MPQVRSFASTAALALVVSACDAGSSSSLEPGPVWPTDSKCQAGDPALATREIDELYALPEVPTFDFWLPPDEWQALKKDARDEQYVPVEGCFEGKSLGTVGLRFKGAYGSLYSCFDAQGELICPKLPLKVKFDEYVGGQRFFEQKRLNLHSMRWDTTRLHERIAYDTYRAMDVFAPRSAWAMVRVNGAVEGLFAMVEQIDGRFTDQRFSGGGDGNLYKEAWPTVEGEEYYRERLDTNQESASTENVVTFARELNQPSAADRLAALGRFTDLDYLYRYMAVDDAIANYDGIQTFYVDENWSWWGNHNFYLYEEEDRPFFWLVPWDLESTLNINAAFEAVPRWTTTPQDCSTMYPVWGDSLVLTPGCDPLLSALAEDMAPYQAAVQELLQGPFSEQTLLDNIERDVELIRDAVRADPNGPSESQWDGSIAHLKSQIPVLRARLEQLGKGLPFDSWSVNTSAVNDFETLDDFSLLTGTTLQSNPSSTVSCSINRDQPIAGGADLLLRFDYRNDPMPWQQWIHFSLPLSNGDLSSFTGIRLRTRADRLRTLRVDVESPLDSSGLEGIHLGWDVPVSPAATLSEVRFADLRVPAWAIAQGRDPADDRAAILASVFGIAFNPSCEGRNDHGFLPEGVEDSGYVQIDEIEFF